MRLRPILNRLWEMYSKRANPNWKDPLAIPPLPTRRSSPGLSDHYPVPETTVTVEEVIRRSRFLTTLGRAANRTRALAFVQEARDRFPGATHHCWAFNAGAPSSSAHVGMSDAGEPRGTAGAPMLSVLLHSGVGEVVAVCARYFGGVKLGRGGLARAYATGVKRALAACPRVEKVETAPIHVVVAYDAIERVEGVFTALGAIVIERSFGADVRYRALIPPGRRSALAAAIADATAGRGNVTSLPT